MKTSKSPWQQERANSKQVREEKRVAVLRAAAIEFREKGFHNASLDEIAARLGVSKPTLYYYIADKQDLVFECGRPAISCLLNCIMASETSNVPAMEKLEEFFSRYADVMAGDFGYCLAMTMETDVAPTKAEQLRKEKRILDHAVRKIINGGIEDGSIKPCDSKATTFAMFGAYNWIAKWHRPEHGSIEDYSKKFFTLFRDGLTP